MKPKKVKPAQKGTKNKEGDYIVTSIDIPDNRTGIKKGEEGAAGEGEEEEDSDTEYDEEDDTKEAQAVPEETKQEGKYIYKYKSLMGRRCYEGHILSIR